MTIATSAPAFALQNTNGILNVFAVTDGGFPQGAGSGCPRLPAARLLVESCAGLARPSPLAPLPSPMHRWDGSGTARCCSAARGERLPMMSLPSGRWGAELVTALMR
ncbi:hypothetical protein ANANG_G00287150 [Anguilla anguilla]|uniref:Uncharacterized protein n=1 Tax=Anguilla anguilla TaxID=7936 RepID=A0A9D3RIX3_ANGAN|nr:hypothetical protein ANANG_G00287150 [Anguilla anguilla]